MIFFCALILVHKMVRNEDFISILKGSVNSISLDLLWRFYYILSSIYTINNLTVDSRVSNGRDNSNEG